MSAAELWLHVAGCVVGVVAAWAAARVLRGRAGDTMKWVPREFKGYTLVYSERTFRSRGERNLVARVDRAYRGRDGMLALVELKTRQTDRIHLSDIIELSAQRVALAGETGESVARFGWVVVESGTRRLAHRVTLMSPRAVWDLAARRDALMAGTESPNYPVSSGVCTSCAYRRRCQLRS